MKIECLTGGTQDAQLNQVYLASNKKQPRYRYHQEASIYWPWAQPPLDLHYGQKLSPHPAIAYKKGDN